MTRAAIDNANVRAFLDMIAVSEIGRLQLSVTDDGYNVLVGSRANSLRLFNSYAAHPHVYNAAFNSTAAGRYQFIFGTWKGLADRLHLVDFSPASQDAACVELLHECKAYPHVITGEFLRAMAFASSQWASLPGSTAGQHVNVARDLMRAYQAAGGTVADKGG